MHSCLYAGRVRHRRRSPARHWFGYRLFMVYLDLDELHRVFHGRWLWSTAKPNLAWFRRSDHLGDPDIPLGDAVRDLVKEHTGVPAQGPIRLLTHLRYFGYGFNPVSFYYCFDPQGARVETIVAEVNNTPWGEQHCYVLRADQDSGRHGHKRFKLPKSFHVSPYMPMRIEYDWRFSTPDENLSVHMESYRAASKIFDATLTLRRRPISGATLTAILARHPVMTAKVTTSIYYQALRLWCKRVPLYTHPKKRNTASRTKDLPHESNPNN